MTTASGSRSTRRADLDPAAEGSGEAPELHRSSVITVAQVGLGARALWREPAFGPYRSKRWAQRALAVRSALLQPDPESVAMQRVRRRVPVNRLVGRRRELGTA